MPKLSEVITAVLSSLDNAQHQSNKFSRKLADCYKNDDIMKYFALPNAAVAEADITLRYAMKDVVQAASDACATIDDSKTETLYAARTDASKIVSEIMRNDDFRGEIESSGLKIQDVSNKMVDSISETIYQGNKKGFASDDIAKYAMRNVHDMFDDSPNVQKKIQSSMVESFQNTLNKSPKIMGTEVNEDKDLEIIVDNDILQKLPEFVIQTIQIKAKVKNYHWIVNDNSSTGEFVQAD